MCVTMHSGCCWKVWEGQPQGQESGILCLPVQSPQFPGTFEAILCCSRLVHRRLFWHLSETPNLLVSWTHLLIQEVDYSFSVFPFRCL